ncbi:hypothetical protein JL720_14586 [Aureococcus anophagefferens]|nr:hypothetical protein JL720_14586 [Aureococcus anophagefferens]
MSGGRGGSEPTCGMAEFLVFVGALVAGTGCSLCSKVLLSMQSVGLSGELESFQNPLFQTWGMFLGMVFALPVHFLMEANKRRKKKRCYARRSATTRRMLRGRCVFVAILKHAVIKDKLSGFMWVGVGLNVVSILLVGATASSSGGPEGKTRFGVGLILAAFVQSLQCAFEEKVMSGDVGAPPLLVIGMEGFWGFFVCTFVLYPLLGCVGPVRHVGHVQEPTEIQGMFLLYFVSIFFYNIAVLVTFMLNSVRRVLDNFRPITVWVTDLFLFYAVTAGVVAPQIALIHGTPGSAARQRRAASRETIAELRRSRRLAHEPMRSRAPSPVIPANLSP